jgi:hypothetical protein
MPPQLSECTQDPNLRAKARGTAPKDKKNIKPKTPNPEKN